MVNHDSKRKHVIGFSERCFLLSPLLYNNSFLSIAVIFNVKTSYEILSLALPI